MSGLLTALGAIAFIGGGIFVACYIVYPAIEWLHDLIMGKEYRAWKRERAEEAEVRGFWFRRMEKIQEELDAEEDERRLNEAAMQNEIQRAELRRRLEERQKDKE